MPFQAPTLATFVGSDTNYVTKMNSNVALITAAFETIEADIAETFSASGMVFSADWTRKSSLSDPTYGVIGAYNFWFEDSGSNVLTLKVSPVTGTSAIDDNGTRRSSTSDLTFDMSTLSLSDADYTLFVGLDQSGTSGVTIGVSQSESDIEMVIYEIDITVSGTGTVYTINRVKRTELTMYWDNTVEQIRQDVPMVMTWSWDALATGDDWRFSLPVDAKLYRMVVWNEANVGFSQITLQNSGGTIDLADWAENPAADEISIVTPTDYEGVAWAAGTEFLFNVPLIGAGGGRWVVSAEWIPTYNLPTQ